MLIHEALDDVLDSRNDVRPQPLRHRPSRCKVPFVVPQDFAHQFFAFPLVTGLRCLDEHRHRPLPTELALAGLESDILLDDIEAKTGHGQDD